MIPRVEATLIDLLRQHNTAILPKLGTILRAKENGTHKFEYNPDIEDNALLEGLKIEFPGNAEALLNQYIEGIKASLMSSGSFMINGVGRIIRDKNGVVHFISALAQAPAAKATLARPAAPTEEQPEAKSAEKIVPPQKENTESAQKPEPKVEQPTNEKKAATVASTPKSVDNEKGKPVFAMILSLIFILLSLGALGYKVVILHGGQAHVATEDELHLQPATNQEIYLIQKEINKEENALMFAHGKEEHAEESDHHESTSEPTNDEENLEAQAEQSEATSESESVQENKPTVAIQEEVKPVEKPKAKEKPAVAVAPASSAPTSNVTEAQLVDINNSNRSIIIVEPCYSGDANSKKFVQALSNNSVSPDAAQGLSCITLYKAGEWGKSKSEMQKLKSQIESGAFMYVF